jgi:D-alanyl-D-alanine carboxypeptidase/D-alanyl-D-alanine-endopeptidase (penicillin-binding protein 4)
MGAAPVIEKAMKTKSPLLLLALLVFWQFHASAAEKLAPQTETKIRAILDSPALASAHVGLSILDLGTVKSESDFPACAPIGKPFRVVFENNARKKFMPASNMKLFTATIALHLLGKDKTFPTRIYQFENQLLLRGGGDPSLGVEGINDLAKQIAALGVSEVSSVVGDGSAFTAETENGKYPFGWIMDDARWYYGPEISALAIERNQLDVIITGGAQPGVLAKVALDSPVASLFRLSANVVTGVPELQQKSEEELIDCNWGNALGLKSVANRADAKSFVAPSFSQEALFVSGEVAPQQKIDLGIAFPSPPQVAAIVLQNELSTRGITVLWSPPPPRAASLPAFALATHNSPPLEILLQRLLKKSDNLYAEMLLRGAAFYHDGEKNGTAPRAHELLKQWLIAQNIDTSELRFEDGSGLSRYNLLTPRATAELLAAINRMPQGEAVWNALPIAGVDGTLKNRFGSTPATSNVRAKTGTFSIASNLSGYVTTRDKKRLAVALFINFARDTETARRAQDAIFTALASGAVVDEVAK